MRTICVHLGLLLGVGGQMQELRRVRSGVFLKFYEIKRCSGTCTTTLFLRFKVFLVKKII